MNAPSNMHEMKIGTLMPSMPEGPIPVEPFISPEYFKKEKEKIFKRAWINVGRVSAHLPNPGDYMVRDLDVFNTSILLVHGRDGVVRAFHNVCTHRANLVATGAGNVRSAFVCGFHGWAFGLDGALKTVPSEEQFPGLNRASYGLPKISTEIWHGWIFINMQASPDKSLTEFLGDWGKQMESIPYEDYDHIGRYTTQLKCNWKVYIDAFQEAYHVGIVHAESLPDLAANPETFILGSFRTYGPHRSLSVWADPNHKPSPGEMLAWKYGGAITPGKDESLKSSNTNPSNDENWWFDINVCFPNFFIDIGTGWMLSYNFFPVSENETFWEINSYQLKATSVGQKIAQSYTSNSLRDILYEDLSTMEGVQRGLDSGILKSIVLGNFELPVRHQYWAVSKWVDGAK